MARHIKIVYSLIILVLSLQLINVCFDQCEDCFGHHEAEASLCSIEECSDNCESKDETIQSETFKLRPCLSQPTSVEAQVTLIKQTFSSGNYFPIVHSPPTYIIHSSLLI